MRKSWFITTVIVLAILMSLSMQKQTKQTRNLPTFQQFKDRFNKTYATAEQQTYRKQVYDQNRKDLLQNTECEDCGVNVYSDLTPEERIGTLFGLKVPDNFQQIVAENQRKVKSKLKNTAVSFPTSLDWREKKAVTKVRNQGGCGSCWAFEMTAAAESLLLIQGKGNVSTLDLSQQSLLQCTSGSSCSGGYPSRAAQVIISGGGMYNQSTYPYKPTKFYKGSICQVSKKKDFPSPAVSSANYYGISDQQIIELLQVSPIGVTIDADSLSSRYDPTKNPVHKCSVGDNQINHGVLLVGYTPTYWIIKNSWGPKWGLDGFAYISRNRANNENCVIQTWITVLQANCTIANCAQCNSKTTCSICKQGFYLAKDSATCKPCLDKNCLSCYTAKQNPALEGRCKICKPTFSLQVSTQICTKISQINIANCLVYSSDFDTCLTCDDLYVLSQDAKQCLLCQVKNCEQCLTGYTNRCRTCKPGYYGDNCQAICSDKCQGGCDKPGICLKCKEGYTGKNCEIIICKEHCLKCDQPGTCKECEEGWKGENCTEKAEVINKCASYIKNCAKGCTKDPNVCDSCDQGFFGPQCNIQYTCDSQQCKTTVTNSKQSLKKQEKPSSDTSTDPNKKTSQTLDSTLNDSAPSKQKQAGLTIGLIVISILFVFTLGFAAFLIYRLRTIKRINIIQPLDNDGSSKSIPYVGKNVPV